MILPLLVVCSFNARWLVFFWLAKFTRVGFLPMSMEVTHVFSPSPLFFMEEMVLAPRFRDEGTPQ